MYLLAEGVLYAVLDSTERGRSKLLIGSEIRFVLVVIAWQSFNGHHQRLITIIDVQARAQASAALLLVASAVEKASSFDKEYEVTKGLATALHSAYARALGLLAQIQVCLLLLAGTASLAMKMRLALRCGI